MNRKATIQVFEHDRLVIKNDSPLEQRHLTSLMKLNELHGFKYFDFISNGIKFKQYVGVIEVDDLTIEILPKADNEGGDENVWRNVLLQMLRITKIIDVENFGDAHVSKNHNNLLDVYFQLYLNELEQLIRLGLINKYRSRKANVKSLKGKLEFAEHIRKNIVHKERFYTQHQIYDQDHLIHQVLKKALDIVENFTKGSNLYDRVKRVQLDFPEVKKVKIASTTFDKIILNRKSSIYKKAISISKMIILNYSPNIESGQEKMLALLFDMNKLWEGYMTEMLRKATYNIKEIEILGKRRKPFWRNNYLEPDIVIEVNDGKEKQTVIIDTKWKRTTKGVSISDLRQMYAYNKFWKSSNAILLYPGDQDDSNFIHFEDTTEEEEKHYCKLGFVHVLKGNKLDMDIGCEILKKLEDKDLNCLRNDAR